MKLKLALPICLALTFNSTIALAQTENVDLNNVSLEDLLNSKVTTATKIEQKQSEAPGILTVLKHEHMQDYGWLTLNDALDHQAGFFPSRDYDRRTIGSRGLFEGWNNNHILMLIDGVPFNDPMYGTAYTWEITPTSMVKSVEVLRGPGSALYGSNATNGVIALQTYSGQDLKGRAEASFRAGSYNTTEWKAMTGNANDHVSYVVAAEGLQTAGLSYESYDASGLTTSNGDAVKRRLRDDRSNRYLFFKAEGQQELKGLSFEFHDQTWHYQTGYGWLFAIPDQPESMNESRQVAVASYKTPGDHTWMNEFTVKYEHKENDWYTRYYPNGFSGYPNGATEYLDFAFDQYFSRAQTTYNLGQRASVLLGAEASAFDYKGDRAHNSNTNLNGDFSANSGNATLPANDALGLISKKPIVNVAAFTQVGTGEWLGPLQLTAGARYDNETVHFDESKANPAGTGNGTRTFNQLSPRLAAVYVASEDLSFKLLLGRAFRAPAPSELAGVNTWALANNIRGLKPETITTVELGSEVRVNRSLNLKVNAFHTKVADQIGYNQSQANLSTNIYSTTTAGLETEANYKNGKWGGFFNFSFAKRLAESISDTTVSSEPKTVTWAPSLTSNLGATYELTQDLKIAGVFQYMGEVLRRDTDMTTAANVTKRGDRIPPWYGLDTNFAYKLTRDDTVDLSIRNLLDQRSHLIKNRDYAFDYQVEGINYSVTLTHTF